MNRFSYDFAFEQYNILKEIFLANNISHEITGSLRRKKPDIGDIDILFYEKDKKKVMDLLNSLDIIEKRINKDELLLKSGISVHLIFEKKEKFIYTLWSSTGSKPYVKKIKNMYIDNNKKIDELVTNEEKIFTDINLLYVKPENRYNG